MFVDLPAALLPLSRTVHQPVQDWTGTWTSLPKVSLQPRTVEQVASILQVAADKGIPVGITAGNTGLVGGTIPPAPDWLQLDCTNLTQTISIDSATGILTASAGHTLAEVQQCAAAAGRHYGVDLAARESATIGGTVATNAGGIHACRYGSTAAQLAGVEFVRIDGTVVDSRSFHLKDNSGLDLPRLLCGSEGTLGVIGTVYLRTHPMPPPLAVLTLRVPSLAAAAQLAASAATVARPQAVEVYSANPPGQEADYRLLVEVPATDLDNVGTALADETGTPIEVATDPAGRRALWLPREQQTLQWSEMTGLYKFDVSLATQHMDAAVATIAQETKATVGCFGHILDGNLHIQVADGQVDPTDLVLRIISEFGGAISAEHGIGRAKAPYLRLARSVAEIDTMAAVKSALDPKWLLNPGILFPNDARPGEIQDT